MRRFTPPGASESIPTVLPCPTHFSCWHLIKSVCCLYFHPPGEQVYDHYYSSIASAIIREMILSKASAWDSKYAWKETGATSLLCKSYFSVFIVAIMNGWPIFFVRVFLNINSICLTKLLQYCIWNIKNHQKSCLRTDGTLDFCFYHDWPY